MFVKTPSISSILAGRTMRGSGVDFLVADGHGGLVSETFGDAERVALGRAAATERLCIALRRL